MTENMTSEDFTDELSDEALYRGTEFAGCVQSFNSLAPTNCGS